MSGVSSSSPLEGSQPPYKSQFVASAQFKQFWERLFQGTSLTDQQVNQMTDQFVRNVWNQMSEVLNWALEQQKKRHQQEQEEGG